MIGIAVDPADVQVELPVPVTVDASGVEGPSAGLMTALTVYDKLSPTDVAAGRHIAGTGSLDIDGNVGGIGRIEAKARAAAAAGAQLFLAPASQAADARSVLGTDVPVIGVTTFRQALATRTRAAGARGFGCSTRSVRDAALRAGVPPARVLRSPTVQPPGADTG